MIRSFRSTLSLYLKLTYLSQPYTLHTTASHSW